jgi:hypothetical protein
MGAYDVSIASVCRYRLLHRRPSRHLHRAPRRRRHAVAADEIIGSTENPPLALALMWLRASRKPWRSTPTVTSPTPAYAG